MTVIMSDAAVSAARSFTFDFRSTTLGLACVAVLIALMFVRELLSAYGGAASRITVLTLDVVIWPLFVLFAAIVGVRLIELI